MTGEAPRSGGAFAVGYLCFLLVDRVSDVLTYGAASQVPFTVALFVLPVLYAVPGTRRVLARYRWQVLAGQVLLTVRGRVSWLLSGGLLTAEVVVRVTLTGLPIAPAWEAIVYVTTYYLIDALGFFGLVRLGQVVGDVQEARGQAADLAVAGERLQAARSLQSAIGDRIARVAAKAAAARRSLPGGQAQALALIAAAGVTARAAVAQAPAAT